MFPDEGRPKTAKEAGDEATLLGRQTSQRALLEAERILLSNLFRNLSEGVLNGNVQVIDFHQFTGLNEDDIMRYGWREFRGSNNKRIVFTYTVDPLLDQAKIDAFLQMEGTVYDEVRDLLRKAGRDDLANLIPCIQSGHAGVLPDGKIVDIRLRRDAVPIASNDALGYKRAEEKDDV